MKEAPIKLSGCRKVTLINAAGNKFTQELSPDGKFYIPPGYEGARFFARKGSGAEALVQQGELKYGK